MFEYYSIQVLPFIVVCRTDAAFGLKNPKLSNIIPNRKRIEFCVIDRKGHKLWIRVSQKGLPLKDDGASGRFFWMDGKYGRFGPCFELHQSSHIQLLF